ncbi:MAG: NAD(P)/FAD-dependent oxidoreductase [Myxococcota bacterium]
MRSFYLFWLDLLAPRCSGLLVRAGSSVRIGRHRHPVLLKGSPKLSSILIIGGGLAGLSCAWRLSRAGHDVEVLERDAEPGGRLRSERLDEFRLDWGAPFLRSGDRNLHGLARTLDLEQEIRPLGPPGFATLRNGRLEAFDFGGRSERGPEKWKERWERWRGPRLSGAARMRLLRLAALLRRRRRWLEPLRPERAAPLEQEEGLADLAGLVGGELLDAVVEPVLRLACDAELDELSGAFTLLALHAADRGFVFQCIDGGVGRFTSAFAEGVSLRAGCEVHAVETERSGARVRYRVGSRERSALADAVVLAVPGPLIPELCPKLAPAERGFFESLRYGRRLVCHLVLDEAPSAASHYALAFPRRPDQPLAWLGFDHLKPGAAPEGRGLLQVHFDEAAASKLWQASESDLADVIAEQLAHTPIGRVSPRRVFARRFSLYRRGFPPGSLGRLAAFLARSERTPRLEFAGDYLIGQRVEGAVTSGMRAASEVLRAIEASA